MSTTAARRRLIRGLLTDHPVASQQQLVVLLAGEGHAVTQATVSRDLAALGAVKTAEGGYVLNTDAVKTEALTVLGRAIDEFAESIVASGNLVVVRTPPGAAQVVARAVDAAEVAGVLGTVAGDDTLIIVASERVGGRRIVRTLEQMGASA